MCPAASSCSAGRRWHSPTRVSAQSKPRASFADKQAVGQLRDVKAAGYRNFFGMAGQHRFFHTPADDLRITGPESLEPFARAFAQAVRRAAERGAKAFE
jgi:hypothetical protein